MDKWYVDENGKLLGYFYSSNIDNGSDDLYPGATVVLTRPPSASSYWSFADNLWHEVGVSPAAFYEFDYIEKKWKDSRTPESQWILLREERNLELQNSDWTQLPDVVMDVGLQQQWKTYRQALRDVTQQPDPFNIVWPTRPA